MMSYVPHGDDVSKIFMAFEKFCARVTIMPSLVVIGKQIKEKQKAGCFYDASVFYTWIESTTVSFFVHTMLA